MSDMSASTEEHVRLRPFTVGEYHRMGSAGILGPAERVQLLNGRIVEMPPIGPPHAYVVTALDDVLRGTFQGRAIVRAQQPLTLGSFSEPEPDIVLAREPATRYRSAHPTAADAYLVIEVSKSTLPFDRGEKLAAYAQAGVPEYWIVNLVDQVVERYDRPDGARFTERTILRSGERITLRAYPDDTIAIDDLLGISPP